ncbi:MAG: hypothetical protein ACOVOR_03110 [Rhabdochlamydiaceae bacterium]
MVISSLKEFINTSSPSSLAFTLSVPTVILVKSQLDSLVRVLGRKQEQRYDWMREVSGFVISSILVLKIMHQFNLVFIFPKALYLLLNTSGFLYFFDARENIFKDVHLSVLLGHFLSYFSSYSLYPIPIDPFLGGIFLGEAYLTERSTRVISDRLLHPLLSRVVSVSVAICLTLKVMTLAKILHTLPPIVPILWASVGVIVAVSIFSRLQHMINIVVSLVFLGIALSLVPYGNMLALLRVVPYFSYWVNLM